MLEYSISELESHFNPQVFYADLFSAKKKMKLLISSFFFSKVIEIMALCQAYC